MMKDGTSVRRLMRLLLLVTLLVVAVALPAFGQEIEPETATGQAVNVVVTVGFLALVVAYLIEFVQGKFAGLDGDFIRLAAVALGYGAAWLWDLDVAADFGFEGLPVALSYLVAALVIAGVSGIIATGKNVLRSKDPTSSMPSQ